MKKIDTETLFLGDNLTALSSIPDKSIHLVATDPPFNKGKSFHGDSDSLAEDAIFKDQWNWERDGAQELLAIIKSKNRPACALIEAIRLTAGDNTAAFLCWLGVRLIEIHRVLRDDGSIYLHCDSVASHYLKAIMDSMFGKDNFRNEIAWCYMGSNPTIKNRFPNKKDSILFYANPGATFNRQYTPYREYYIQNYYNKVNSAGRRYRTHSRTRDGKQRVLYLDESQGAPVLDWWTDIHSFGTATQSKERTGYPTQKPLALYERIIKTSSNEGDVVLDPFCGSGTTLVAAELLGRRWIGIDQSENALSIASSRLGVSGRA